MAKKILVTRPINEARDFAGEIVHIGAEPVLSPLLDIEYIHIDFKSLSKPDALLLTSSQAMDNRNFPVEWTECPAFCVGEKTARTARNAGIKNVITGNYGIESILPLITEKLPAGSCLLYLCGEQVSRDIQVVLPDYKITSVLTYRAKAVEDLSAHIIADFPKLDIITLFSPRTGEILSSLIQKNGLMPRTGNIKLLCLSASVLESVGNIEWKSREVADAPTQDAMILKLKTMIADHE